jgi:hypothetical protein
MAEHANRAKAVGIRMRGVRGLGNFWGKFCIPVGRLSLGEISEDDDNRNNEGSSQQQ